MVLHLTTADVEKVLTMKVTLEALEVLYKELGEKQAVCGDGLFRESFRIFAIAKRDQNHIFYMVIGGFEHALIPL